MSKTKKKNKESVVRDIVTIVCASAMIPIAIALLCRGEYECALLDIVTIVCASAMIPIAIALLCRGEYECALLGLILARLMLWGK